MRFFLLKNHPFGVMNITTENKQSGAVTIDFKKMRFAPPSPTPPPKKKLIEKKTYEESVGLQINYHPSVAGCSFSIKFK